jgi:uncharacterized protein (TIGR02594 family)
MFQAIFTNVSANEVDAFTNDIVQDDGRVIATTQERDGRFTLIAEFRADPPAAAPVAGGAAFPWMAIAETELANGVKETRSNPRIEEYFATTSFGRHPDSEPWCSAFANFCVTQSGVEGTNSALALSWLDWGQDAGGFVPGCIVVLSRGTPGQGHVGFFVGQDANGSISLLGGNQHDSVNVSTFPSARVIGMRVPLPAQLGAAANSPTPVPAPAGPGAPTVVAEEDAGADDGFGGLARRAFNFFVQSGWEPAQAAGLVANIETESSFRTDALGDGGQAHGICQWHSDRFDKFPICFPGRTIDGSTFDEQLQFVNFELLDPRSGNDGNLPTEHRAAERLRAAQDARTAGGVVSQFYERPGDVQGNIALRGRRAEKWFAKFAT